MSKNKIENAIVHIFAIILAIGLIVGIFFLLGWVFTSGFNWMMAAFSIDVPQMPVWIGGCIITILSLLLRPKTPIDQKTKQKFANLFNK